MFPEQSPEFSRRSPLPSGEKSKVPAHPQQPESADPPILNAPRWLTDHRLQQASMFLTWRSDVVEDSAILALPDLDNGDGGYENKQFVEVMKEAASKYSALRDDLREICSDLDIIDAKLAAVLPPEFGGHAVVANRSAVHDITSSEMNPALTRLLMKTKEGFELNNEVCEKARQKALDAGIEIDDGVSAGGVLVVGGHGNWFDDYLSSQSDLMRKVELAVASMTCGALAYPEPCKVPIGPWLSDVCRDDVLPESLNGEEWPVRLIDHESSASAILETRFLLRRIATVAVEGELLRRFFDGRPSHELPEEEKFLGSKAYAALRSGAEFLDDPEPILSFVREPYLDGHPRKGYFDLRFNLSSEFSTAVTSALRSEAEVMKAISNHAESAGLQLQLASGLDADGAWLRARFNFIEERDGKNLPAIRPEPVLESKVIVLGEEAPVSDMLRQVYFQTPGAVAPITMSVPQEGFFTASGRKFVREAALFAQGIAKADPLFQYLEFHPMGPGGFGNAEQTSASCEDSFTKRNVALHFHANSLLAPGVRRGEQHPLNVLFPWEDDEKMERARFNLELSKPVLMSRKLTVEPPLMDNRKFHSKFMALTEKLSFLDLAFSCEPIGFYGPKAGVRLSTALLDGLAEATDRLTVAGEKRKIYVAELDVDTQRTSLANLQKGFNFYDARGHLSGRGWFFGNPAERTKPHFEFVPLKRRDIKHAQDLVYTALNRADRSVFEDTQRLKEQLAKHRVDACGTLLQKLFIDEAVMIPEEDSPFTAVFEKLHQFWTSPFIWVERHGDRVKVFHRGDPVEQNGGPPPALPQRS